jgi:putative NADH-flavin reductase
MKVLVLGASGRTGRELLAQGVAQGHSVTAFVRNPARLRPSDSKIRVRCGDVADRASVESAIAGQNAVICATGTSSHLKPDLKLVIGMHNVICAMERCDASRLIYLSNDSVRDVRYSLNFFRRYLILPLLLRHVVACHETNEAMIKQSSLDWTIVRPPTLTEGRRVGSCRSGEVVMANSLFPHLSRADLAAFLLKQLTENTFLRQGPVVMY